MLRLKLSLVVLLMPCIVFAQSTKQTVSVSIVRQDLRSALDGFFADSGRRYEIDAQVRSVEIPPVNIDSVPFDAALHSLLKSVGLNFAVVDGVYRIFNSPSGKPPATTVPAHALDTTQKYAVPALTATQSNVSVPLGVRLSLAGSLAAAPGPTKLASAQLRVNNEVLETCQVDKTGAYVLRVPTMAPLSGPFRIVGVMSDGTTFIGKKGFVDVYDPSITPTAPIAVSDLRTERFAQASFGIVGGSKPECVSLILEPCGVSASDAGIEIRAGATDSNGRLSVDLDGLVMTSYQAWPVMRKTDELSVGPAVVLAVPEYLRILNPQPNAAWLVADSSTGQRIEMEAKGISHAEVSVVVDGNAMATGTIADARLNLLVPDPTLNSGPHVLWAVAKSSGKCMVTPTLPVNVKNPQMDAVEAQLAAQRRARDEQQRQQAEVSRREQADREAAIRATVLDKYYQLSAGQQAFIRERYTQYVVGMAAGSGGNTTFQGPSLLDYLISHQDLLQ